MPLITLGGNNELVLKIPSKGDTGWADDFKNEFAQKIVIHDHSGGTLGKRVDILNLDKVQQGVSPGNGNALIWDASANNGVGEFRFLNPATSVSPTAFALQSTQDSTAQAVTNSFSTVIPPATSNIPIQEQVQPGVTGWNTSTGKYKFPTTGMYRLSASVLVNSIREDVAISILARKTGASTQNVKTITKKVQSNLPVGSVVAWAGSGTPGADYLRCDGSQYARTAYPDLEAVIGSTYATHNGNTTPNTGNFNVPNHVGEFLRDKGSGNIEDVQAQATAVNGLTASSSASLTGSTGTGTTGSKNLSHRHHVVKNAAVNSPGKDVLVGNDPNYAASRQNNHNNDNNFDMNGFNGNADYFRSSTPINATDNLNHSHSIPSLSVTVSGSVTTTVDGGDSETRPENTKVAYYIKAKNTCSEQIVLTALVSATALDEIAIMVKTNIAADGGVEVFFDDTDTPGFTLDLEKLE